MNKSFSFILALLSLTIFSCDKKSESTVIVKEETVTQKTPDKLGEIWKSLPLRSLPLNDSTNFDTFKVGTELIMTEIQLLQLFKVYPELASVDSQFKVFPSYKLNISDNYYSIVLIIKKGEHELESILLNYDLSENLSGYKVIAYDEIAESFFRTSSRIEKDFVTVTEESYVDGKKVTIKKFHINRNGEFNEIKTNFKSDIRPNLKIILNKIYTDTIEFGAYNDNYDYWYLEGKKNGNEIRLIYNWKEGTESKYDFKYGDILKVQWKMDSIFIAGDGETLDFAERVIDAVKIKSRDESKPTKFLYRADQYNEETMQTENTIIINEALISSLSTQEKAALGYVATFIGNECWWDGEANNDRSNLKCKILTALDLGYQCSDKHLGFLRKWFSKDKAAIEDLENCGTMPYTATIQNSFDEILISKDSKSKIIKITFKATGVNVRESKSWSWIQTDTFLYDVSNIKLVSSEKKDI